MWVVTSSVVDQFKEILLLESLLNLQKVACNICHIPSKCNSTLPCKMANNVRVHLEFANQGVKHSDKHVHRIVNYLEQLIVN